MLDGNDLIPTNLLESNIDLTLDDGSCRTTNSVSLFNTILKVENVLYIFGEMGRE